MKAAYLLGVVTFIVASEAHAVQLTELDVGTQHACVVTDCGKIECWGGTANNYGEAYDRYGDYVDVAVGQDHTCALANDGTVECWGDPSDGRLEPWFATQGDFEQIDSFMDFTCAIVSGGDVECWGADGDGQSSSAFFLPDVYSEVVTGVDRACALAEDGSAIDCWGRDLSPFTERFEAFDILPSANDQWAPERFVEIAVGYSHFCAVSDYSRLYCWGDNSFEQVTALNDGVPYAEEVFPGVYRHVGTVWKHVSAGYFGTCGSGRETNGSPTVQCWGYPYSTGPSYPVTQMDPDQLSVGFQHACGLDRGTDTVQCWGNNTSTPGTPHAGGLTDVPPMCGWDFTFPTFPPPFQPIFPGW